jgi:monovalent cation/proton antiporter MnhG/PhaG subunit
VILELVGVAGKLAGVAFLLVAAIGVLRLPDPFMRMHAATKAGTLGAGLVVIFAAVYLGDIDAKMIAAGIVVFLLGTLPVASHLLGRAAYVSGAAFEGAGDRDALRGVLARQSLPLEARLKPAGGASFLAPSQPAPDLAPAARTPDAKVVQAADRPADTEAEARAALRRELPAARPLSGVTLAVLDGLPASAYRRIAAFGHEAGAQVTALATVDRGLLEAVDRPAAAADALAGMRTALDRVIAERLGDRRIAIHFEEGDPGDLLHGLAPAEGLLVLPQDGWFHHGVELPVAGFQRGSDKLLALAARHPARKLFVPRNGQPVERLLALDDGSSQLLETLHWALSHRLWPEVELLVADAHGREVSPTRRALLGAVAETAGLAPAVVAGGRVADHAASCQAVVSGPLRPPFRTDWYGRHWLDRVAPGWRGELLVP